MRFRYALTALATATAAIALAAPVPAAAQSMDKSTGWLCCNMRSADGEMYDINYEDEGSRIVPFGSPVTVRSQGRRSIRMEIGGERHVLENHYSRDLPEAEFVARYVVSEDPRIAAASFPEKIREAIASARVTPGMTREQVRMSLGWPVSSENPDPEAEVLRFWLSSFDEILVEFDDAGLVTDLIAGPMTRRRLWMP